MRKLFKKIAAVVAATAMTVAMTTTAFAADTTYNVAGAEGLCGVNWDPSANQMTDNGDGTWTKEFTNIAAGTYEFKVVEGGAWGNPDYNLEGSAANGGANASVTVEADGATVVVGFDGEKATVEVKAAGTTTPDTTPDTTPSTGDATAVVAMVAVAALAAAMVVVSRRQTANN